MHNSRRVPTFCPWRRILSKNFVQNFIREQVASVVAAARLLCQGILPFPMKLKYSQKKNRKGQVDMVGFLLTKLSVPQY